MLPTRLPASTWSVEFTPDSRWLASCAIGTPVRLWPMDARDGSFRDLLPTAPCFHIAIDPTGKQVLVGTWYDSERGRADGRMFLYPIGGGSRRQLHTGWEGESWSNTPVRLDRRGRRATASPESDPRQLKLWDLESGAEHSFTLPYAVANHRFGADGSLIVSSVGGLMRLVLPETPGGTPSSEMLFPSSGAAWDFAFGPSDRRLLVVGTRGPGMNSVNLEDSILFLFDLATRTSRRITTHGTRLAHVAFDPSGRFIVTGSADGIVRVGPVTGEEPHLLLGHTGLIESLAVSPDGRWIASGAENQLFLWPTPDVTKPPLHTLPHDELIATLDRLTNLRVVPDASASTGWKLDVGPFPGWKDLPTW
jgi:WD40 repeat protein